MKHRSLLLIPVLSLLASGCASIMSGTEQEIAMHTTPEGAECVLSREGKELRRVVTPETVKVNKLKHDIFVKCNLEGFHESKAHVNSGIQGSVFGNIILSGGIGWAVDSARGADNRYADYVFITMVPSNQAAPKMVSIGADGQAVVRESDDSKEKDSDITSDEE